MVGGFLPKATKCCCRRQLLGGLGAGMVLLPCGCPQPASADGPGTGPWGYGDFDGPPRWGGACANGRRQSPIDLPFVDGGNVALKGPGIGIKLDYAKAAKLQIVNTGHGNIQVNVPDGSTCKVQGRILKLIQWHFHTPSEHSFAGRRQVMEAHFVHKDVQSGELAVIGILLQRGIACQLEALQVALDHAPMPGQPGYTTDGMDLGAMLQDILPGAAKQSGGHYVHYVGSLTTPPCTEGVQWFVAMQPSRVSDAQVLDFQDAIAARKTLGMNSRPLQGMEMDLL